MRFAQNVVKKHPFLMDTFCTDNPCALLLKLDTIGLKLDDKRKKKWTRTVPKVDYCKKK